MACALSSSACGNRKETNENKDPLTGEDQSQQTEESSTTESSANTEAENGYREFDTMLGDENTDPKDIIGYINTNIVSAGVACVAISSYSLEATDTDNNANTASNTNADTVIQGTVSR